MAVSLSVVVTTYEWPEALEAVLGALAEQSDSQFEVVVADDGSGPATRSAVERWREPFGGRLSHVWQEDGGLRLSRVRNLGALASSGDYLVFVDGDCVPRTGFVRALKACALPGWFVAGRRLELSQELTRRALAGKAEVQRWSSARWFVRARRDASGLRALSPRDRRRAGRARLPEFEPQDRAYGFLVGLSRADFERVNGYDIRYVGWGEEDVDLAFRLRRLGLRCGHAGPHATVLHLWHPQRDVRDHPNAHLLDDTERSDRIHAVEGLRELSEATTRA